GAPDVAHGARDELASVVAEVEGLAHHGRRLGRHGAPAREQSNSARETPIDRQVSRKPGLGLPVPNRDAAIATEMVLGVAGHVEAVNTAFRSGVRPNFPAGLLLQGSARPCPAALRLFTLVCDLTRPGHFN